MNVVLLAGILFELFGWYKQLHLNKNICCTSRNFCVYVHLSNTPKTPKERFSVGSVAESIYWAGYKLIDQ